MLYDINQLSRSLLLDLCHVKVKMQKGVEMAAPRDPTEHALVVKAITCRVSGCCEWDEKSAQIFRYNPPLSNLTPEGVKDELIDHVDNGGEVVQVDQTRPEYKDRPFYYKVIVPMQGLRHGLFIEIVLDDDDPDLPVVRIVSGHEQRR